MVSACAESLASDEMEMRELVHRDLVTVGLMGQFLTIWDAGVVCLRDLWVAWAVTATVYRWIHYARGLLSMRNMDNVPFLVAQVCAVSSRELK